MTVARATRRFCRIPLSLLLSLINLLTDRSTAAERRTRPRWCRHEHDVVSIQQQLVWSTRQITQLLASPTTSRDRKHSTPTAGSVVIFAAIIPTLADRTQVSLLLPLHGPTRHVDVRFTMLSRPVYTVAS